MEFAKNPKKFPPFLQYRPELGGFSQLEVIAILLMQKQVMSHIHSTNLLMNMMVLRPLSHLEQGGGADGGLNPVQACSLPDFPTMLKQYTELYTTHNDNNIFVNRNYHDSLHAIGAQLTQQFKQVLSLLQCVPIEREMKVENPPMGTKNAPMNHNNNHNTPTQDNVNPPQTVKVTYYKKSAFTQGIKRILLGHGNVANGAIHAANANADNMVIAQCAQLYPTVMLQNISFILLTTRGLVGTLKQTLSKIVLTNNNKHYMTVAYAIIQQYHNNHHNTILRHIVNNTMTKHDHLNAYFTALQQFQDYSSIGMLYQRMQDTIERFDSVVAMTGGHITLEDFTAPYHSIPQLNQAPSGTHENTHMYDGESSDDDGFGPVLAHKQTEDQRTFAEQRMTDIKQREATA